MAAQLTAKITVPCGEEVNVTINGVRIEVKSQTEEPDGRARKKSQTEEPDGEGKSPPRLVFWFNGKGIFSDFLPNTKGAGATLAPTLGNMSKRISDIK